MKNNSFSIICVFILSSAVMIPVNLNAAALEEIVVTAQKREESLQDANVAVTAMAGGQLEEHRINNIEDLQASLPSVSAGNDFGQAKFFFRGLGLNSSFTAVDPSVAMYVDGAIIPRAEGQLSSFFDLDRIEALRGPQGILYGRNSTGGSLNLITRKPTEEVEGYGKVTWGSHDLLEFRGAVGGPITDKILGRVAFKSTDHDGYAVNEFSGNRVDDANKQAIRGQLQFNFNEDIDFLLSVEYSNEDDADLALSYVENTFGPGDAVPGTGGFPEGRRNIAADREPENDKEMWSITGTLNWRLNDAWSIKSVSNYRDMDMARAWSNDASAVFTDDNIWINFISQAVSQELQLEFDDNGVFRSGDRLQGMLGVYYFNEELNHTQFGGCDSPINPTALSPGCQANGSVARVMEVFADQDIEAIAVFGHASYDFNEQLTLNVGARWTEETREGSNVVFFDFPDFGFTSFFVGNSFSDRLMLRGKFDDFSPSVGIEWKPVVEPFNNTNFYFTYSEGFKSGGMLSGFGTNVVEPEEVENFEIGMKNEFFDRKMRLNIAGFIYDAKNLQFDATIPLPGAQGGFAQRFSNAAAQDGKGIEVELEWNVTENLRISGFGAWLDAEFEEFFSDDPAEPGTALDDLSGNRPRQSPEWSGKIRGEYDFVMGNGGVITLGADWSYKSEQFFTEFNRENLRQDAYSLINANIKYTSPSQRFTVNIWGRNLNDEFVRSGMFASGGGRVITEALLPPITGGITLGYNF